MPMSCSKLIAAPLASLGAVALHMDITRQDEVQAAVQGPGQEHGRVEVLINNAVFGLYGAMEETSLVEARSQFEVNLFGMARLTQKETHQLWIVKSPCE